MTGLVCLLLGVAALVAVGLWLDRHPRMQVTADPLVARLCDDEAWARLLAAVEGDDFALWEREVAS